MIYYYYFFKKTHIFYPPIFKSSQPNKALETYLLQILKASLFFLSTSFCEKGIGVSKELGPKLPNAKIL